MKTEVVNVPAGFAMAFQKIADVVSVKMEDSTSLLNLANVPGISEDLSSDGLNKSHDKLAVKAAELAILLRQIEDLLHF